MSTIDGNKFPRGWPQWDSKKQSCSAEIGNNLSHFSYNNKIDPDLKVTDWSNKEIQKIFRYYNEYGPKWNLI